MFNPEFIREITRYIGFGPEDHARVAEARSFIEPRLDEVVEEFYTRILENEGARQVLKDEAMVAGLKRSFRAWLQELLAGPYDAAYWERHARIGRRHVQVGLAQRYMIVAVSALRLHFLRILLEDDRGPPERGLRVRLSLNRLLDLELAVMLETYAEDTVEKVRGLEQARLEARLAAQESLAIIGQMAATVAHEVRNPLAGISGLIQNLQMRMKDLPAERALMEKILATIDRLDGIVGDLLLYARPVAPRREETTLQAILESALGLLRENPQRGTVEIGVPLPRPSIPIRADGHQLSLAFLNILLNACQAMGGRGRIRIAVERAEKGAVRVVFEDSGPGIPADVLPRIFQPFFTTKSRGTGLGLPVTKRIVESHGGRVSVENLPAGGARFEVTLSLDPVPAARNAG